MSRSSLLLLLLALPSCAEDAAAPEELFTTGSAEELALAEDMAYGALLDHPAGAAVVKGVDELRTMRVQVDQVGMAHTRVQQLLRGVPVWGGEAIVHLTPTGNLSSVTDDLLDAVAVDTTPDWTDEEAIDLAIASWTGGWEYLTDDPTADLWVLRHEGVDHLAWRVTLHQVNHRADDAIPVIFVDAHRGEVVWAYDNLQSASCTGATNFYGTVSVDCNLYGSTYYLEDTTDLLGTYTWNNTTSSLYYLSSSSTTFSNTTEVDINGFEAHYAAQAVYSYYSSTHGRNGIDGAGGPGAVTSHGYDFITSATSYSSNYVNAFWDPTNLMMVYGDGDGTYANSLTTLDIAGHEMTHGVTQYESNLTYSGEPGHMNESMSDVFGAMVERSVQGESSATWLIGEDTWTPGTEGDALRYMNDPAADGSSYDYYASSLSGVDVHYGSGVGNLAFYLLSQGGTHPRGKSTTSVTAIGADDAAKIWYLANATYMTSSTSYSGARTATLNAASALFGSSAQQYTSTADAWSAVGVGSAASCSTSTYSGSLSKTGRSAYAPNSSGTAVTVATQTASLTGPSSADFDLYLQKKSGKSWSTVASSATRGTSTESLSYASSSSTYRVLIYSYSGSGSYSLSWCK